MFLEAGQVVRGLVLTTPGFDLNVIRTSLEDEILEKLVMGFGIRLIGPKFKETDVFVRAFAVRGADRQKVTNDVNAAIDTWLDPLATDADGNFINEFGQALLISDLGLLLKAVVDLFDYEIVTPEANVEIADDEVPTPTHLQTVRTVEVSIEGEVGFLRCDRDRG